jgi:hypothetical protein
MTPERLSNSVAPWLKLKFGDSVGFAPLEWLSLRNPHKNVASGSVGEALRQLGFTGITRKSFLEPITEVLRKAAPRRGTMAQHCESPDQPLDLTATTGDWDQPDAVILGAGAQTNQAIIEFGHGQSRLFSFVSAMGNDSKQVWIEEGSAYVAQAQSIDLDHDGTPDWLLEIVDIYGDGYFSTLWVVNGKQSAGVLQIDRLPLSHASGEDRGPATDAAWWVGPDSKLWIVSAGTDTDLQSFTYQGRLVASPTKTKNGVKGLVVLSDEASYDSGMQSRLKMGGLTGAAGLFPIRSGTAVRWVVARPFDRLADAQDWARKNSLPSSSVLALSTAQ